MTRTSALPFGETTFDAILFDMDGTLLSSIEATERVWFAWGRRHGLDMETLMPKLHGMRAIDTIGRLALPGVDPAVEAAQILADEIADTGGVVPIEGVLAFLASLPADRWAIVTSAPRALAERRLFVAGVTPPAVVVTADDVSRGKPAPDCFQLAAERLGFRAENCLVCEDALAGIAAGEAAGASVLVITATHTHPVETGHPTTPGYGDLRAEATADGTIRVTRAGA
ncbi:MULTISPECIES: HAD-IA family hydrolase [unclassified Aureimonas]|uniref:HAD-IA family hydrolase n=1 Tax=unclassified Aureimonas TaxID=2615206 RepID=UPI0006F1FF28|nr:MULTISPECIES: HAD-IA family hydrolase [unclassified Aureimonas]KQT69910.1 glycerol-3-phosphatase [Aureimonas sp. Leaf427]KQT75936.1 glycerol-3-phosphatase [Aureimonas sp. Leaf460]